MVGIGLKAFVDEDAVPLGAGCFLEGEGDEISKAAAWEGVLIGEEAVVGGELGLRVKFGGFGEEVGGEFASEGGGDGFFEEEPEVAAISRARAFEGCGDVFLTAGGEVGEGIVGPTFAIEIDGEEVAGFIEKHGVDPHDKIAREVASDDFVGNGLPILVGAGVAFDAWFFANATDPFIATDGRVSCFAGLLADEAMRVDFIPATEERAEEGDLFRYR